MIQKVVVTDIHCFFFFLSHYSIAIEPGCRFQNTGCSCCFSVVSIFWNIKTHADIAGLLHGNKVSSIGRVIFPSKLSN